MDCRKKDTYIVNNKKYLIGEPTVWLYRLSLEDTDSFLRELFLEFNKEIPKIGSDQLEQLMINLFDIDEDLFDKILNKENDESLNIKDDFHIIIGQFMKLYPGNSYFDVNNISISDFNKILKDSKIISGEEEYKKNKKSDGKPDKEGLKNLLNN